MNVIVIACFELIFRASVIMHDFAIAFSGGVNMIELSRNLPGFEKFALSQKLHLFIDM